MSDELEAQDGELLPDREVMSVIGTDPAEALVPPGEFSIQPYTEPGEDEWTRPVEPPAA